jgi:hypothetical protein
MSVLTFPLRPENEVVDKEARSVETLTSLISSMNPPSLGLPTYIPISDTLFCRNISAFLAAASAFKAQSFVIMTAILAAADD